ncbi:ABC-2 family transporter, partial [Anaerobacterium chartisolvens]
MLRILYNDICTAKTSILLFILILLVPYINMLIKIPIFMILVINSIRLVTYSDYKNRTTIFYATLPITRKDYIIEKAVFLMSTMIVGVIILLIPLLTNQQGYTALYVSLLIYICGITLLISGLYLLISYAFNPITADFYNEIAALGISLVLGKILIFDRSD